MVPNGIDVAAYRSPPWATNRKAFVGGSTFDRMPGTPLARRAVLPAVNVRLLVGAGPPRWLVEASQSRIAVIGHGCERPYLARCAVLALPMRVAAGSRLKALVAMSSGLPVISTAIGMEGLDAEAGVDYVQAESNEEWSKAIECVLHDAPRRARIASSARALGERRYDWSAIRPSVRAAYEQLHT